MTDLMPLWARIDQLIGQHGSLRAAAIATGIDHGYLSRLYHNKKSNPSTDTLRKLGLVRAVLYYRSEQA